MVTPRLRRSLSIIIIGGFLFYDLASLHNYRLFLSPSFIFLPLSDKFLLTVLFFHLINIGAISVSHGGG
jgi:hypothetical protein